MQSNQSPTPADPATLAGRLTIRPIVPTPVQTAPGDDAVEAIDFAGEGLPDLAGFPMITAISQDTINYQMKKLWQAGAIRRHLEIEVAELGVRLDAALDPPKVKIGADERRGVLFTLALPRGTLRYWEGFGPNAKERTIAFTGWRFAFRVNLDMQEVARAAIESNQAIPPEVKAKLTGIDDSIFTIRSLVMDFQSANLADFDPRESALPLPEGGAAGLATLKALVDALSLHFKSLAGGASPYVLGYNLVRRGAAVDPPALFAPTSATFSTLRDPIEGQSALHFLMMLGGAPPPAGPLAGLFTANWITSADYDGRMAIAEDPFRRRYVEGQFLPSIARSLARGARVPAFTAVTSRADLRQRLGFRPEDVEVFERSFGKLADGPGWATYGYGDNLDVDDGHGNRGYGVIVGTDSGLLKIYREDREAIAFTVEALPGPDIAFRGRGNAWITHHYYEYPLNAKLWMAGVDVSLAFGFDARVIAGADGRLTVAAQFADNTPTAWHDTNPLVKITDVFAGIFGANFSRHIDAARATCEAIQRAVVRDIEDQLRRQFEALSVPVILPAGSVFFYKNAARDPEGNVLFDVSYKRDH